MRPKNILVFPCGSEVALEINASVKFSRYFHLIGASSIGDHGQYVFPDYIGEIPYVDEPGFIDALAHVVKTRHIDAIYPAMDSVISQLKPRECDLGCMVIAPCAETTEICLSKKRTYDALRGTVPLPKVFDATTIQESDFPVFLKPEIGYGSKGALRIDSRRQLSFYLAERPGCMVLEYLPGEEYTIDCFTDKRGELLYALGRSRKRVRNGISVCTSPAPEQGEFYGIAQAINEQIQFRGAWFAQVKRDYLGRLCLLEIAARLGGSSALSRVRGVNLALLTLFDAFEYEVEVSENGVRASLDRAFDCVFKIDARFSRVYVDLDDCLIFKTGVVNSELVAFLYRCMNNKIEIILLTKHAGCLEEALRSSRLQGLFDQVIHIPSKQRKFECMIAEESIFIDDSFAERKEVQEKLGIPSFSPDVVSALAMPD